MKSSKFISASFLSVIMIIVSCKKEEPGYQPIPPREIQSALIYQYGKDIPVEGVTVNLKRCNGTINFGLFNGNTCNGTIVTYRTTLTDANGSFSCDADSTWSYEFHKQGYWSDGMVSSSVGTPNNYNNPPGSPNKYFLIKDAWLKIHFTNVGSPNSVDSIIISAGPEGTPYANLYCRFTVIILITSLFQKPMAMLQTI